MVNLPTVNNDFMTFPPFGTQLSARDATIAAFVALGACVGTWAGSMADVQQASGLSALHIAVVIFIFRVAGIAATQIGGRLADRYGSRNMCRVGFLTMSGSWLVIAATGLNAPPFAGIATIAALAGAGLGMLDVSMNAHATAVDQRHPKPTLGLIHACFSLGAFCGSGMLLAAHALSPDNALWARSGALTAAAVFSLLLLPVFWSGKLLADTPFAGRGGPGAGTGTSETTSQGPKDASERNDPINTDSGGLVSETTPVPTTTPTPHKPFGYNGWVWIGLCAWAVGVAEGSAFDWCAVHVAASGALPQQQAAMALTAVSAAMLIARVASDRILLKVSRPVMVRVAALIGVGGYLLAISSSSPVLVLGAWAAVGFGAGSIAPQVFGAAGRTGSATIVGNVMAFAYAGFLTGPVVVGTLSKYLSVNACLWFPLAACVVVAVMSSQLAPRKTPAAQ